MNNAPAAQTSPQTAEEMIVALRASIAAVERKKLGHSNVRIADPLGHFMSFVSPEPNTGCWLWAGRYTPAGYGAFVPIAGGRSRSQRAHRWLWEELNGKIRQGLVVMHMCDVRCCVNPAHLRLGTQTENNADMNAKGRRRTPWHAPPGSAHHCAKLNEALVVELRRAYAAGAPIRELAKANGVTWGVMRDAVLGRAWKHVPMEPEHSAPVRLTVIEGGVR